MARVCPSPLGRSQRDNLGYRASDGAGVDRSGVDFPPGLARITASVLFGTCVSDAFSRLYGGHDSWFGDGGNSGNGLPVLLLGGLLVTVWTLVQANTPAINTAFVPPNAKELDIIVRIGWSGRAALAT